MENRDIVLLLGLGVVGYYIYNKTKSGSDLNVKTFLEEAVSKILSSHSTIDELIIILPSRRAGVFFKDALTAQLTTPILSPKIFSIEEFIQEISTLKLARSTAALIDFYEIYNANTPSAYLDSFEEFIRWAPALLKDFSDLDA